ncbi:MAG: hypothetical protein ACOCW2_02855, partial [Chitinivibrionales bacterium]
MTVFHGKRILSPRILFALCATAAGMLAGCNNQVIKPSPSTSTAHEEKLVHRVPGDTLSWVVEFPDSLAQEHFLDSFDRFLAQYRTDTIQTDTISHYFHLRMLGMRKPGGDTALSFGILDQPSFSESTIEEDFGAQDTA